MRWWPAAVAFVMALALAACGGDGGDDDDAAAPASSTPALVSRCGDDALGWEAIRFDAPDGTHLAGALRGAGTSGVVLAHQANGDLCRWLAYGTRLAGLGTVLAIDMRGYGDSEDGPDGATERRDLDVVGAAAELRRRGLARVVLVGASRGATATLIAGAEADPPPAAVVALSPPEEQDGQPAGPAVAAAEWPTYVVAAQDDNEYFDDAQAIVQASRGHAEAMEFPKGGHGWEMLEPDAPTYAQLDGLITGLVRGD